MNPSFTVPGEYFYALTANLPPDISPAERYRFVIQQAELQNLLQIKDAVTKGVISTALPYTPEMVSRRLEALGEVTVGGAVCTVPGSGPLYNLIKAYADYNTLNVENDPDADIQPFWDNVAADPNLAQGHLDLVLCAITGDHQPLIDHIKAVPITQVSQLAAYTGEQWEALFDNGSGGIDETLLPPFTYPGSPAERVAAFIRFVTRYFDVIWSDSYVPGTSAEGPPLFETPSSDPLQRFMVEYKAAHPTNQDFVFGQGWQSTPFTDAIEAVFPNDEDEQDWLEQTIRNIDDLYGLTDDGQIDGELRFSLMEALYSRGFYNSSTIQKYQALDFKEALTGTVAYTYSDIIHDNAGGFTGTAVPGNGSFAPINPDGTLMDCLAPDHLSPFGPTSYLHEMLRVSTTSTCANPLPLTGLSLETMVSARRGPIGSLQVTAANLDTRIPVIDLVNESLEKLAVNPLATQGIVHNTATNTLAGHELGESDAKTVRHDAATLFAALPEHSTPATPVQMTIAYDKLAADFSAPGLPYSQPLDIARSYLQEMGTDRYETMRRFRRSITEWAIDATQEPLDFEKHLWRYPIRIDIAREYLGLSPEEHSLLFSASAATLTQTYELYGFTEAQAQSTAWITVASRVSEFTARTGITYCEFLELWQSGFVQFARSGADGQFVGCEPCHLENETIVFQSPSDPGDALRRLAVFIRLWRKLQSVAGADYSFDQLRDICDVLTLFNAGGVVNDEFVRQLAAFQMLRDELELPLDDSDDSTPGTGAERSHLLAIWVGTGARKWSWALDQLLDQIQVFAQRRYQCDARPPELIRVMGKHLAPLSQLAAFNPLDSRDTWYARPTQTLRFAEVLAKIYASDFDVGEILFLFRDDESVGDDDPLHWQSAREALDMPLGMPDDHETHTLLSLRRALRAVTVSDEEAAAWTWTRMDATLRDELGYDIVAGDPDPFISVGEHFFPNILIADGWVVDPLDEQYRVSLASTNSAMWNTPADGPFRYDTGTQELWTVLPLRDAEVLEKLARVRPLLASEQQAVRDLYYAPRTDLVHFAFLFEDFALAQRTLFEETDEDTRWAFFQKHFALFHARCRVIAEHLADHVALATGRTGRADAHDSNTDDDEGAAREQLVRLAWRLLRHLHADENKGLTPWESDSGVPPDTLWESGPRSGAFAALLGLMGTGLVAEYSLDDGASVSWRERHGAMSGFGAAQNAMNAPVATIVPAMDFSLSGEQERWVSARNGFALANRDGTPLGGAQGFSVHWRGVLLVERSGSHEFSAGAPTPEGQEPNFAAAEDRRWRVTLTRGNRSWLLSCHDWPTEQDIARPSTRVSLERGVYQLSVEFSQPEPHAQVDGDEDVCPRTTGLQLKYQGPDTDEQLIAVPFDRLFTEQKLTQLDDQLPAGLTGNARTYLRTWYPSTLRDIRRTYVRAFKSLLLSHRLDLSAEPVADSGQSEIGYMLEHAQEFAGASTYRRPVGFRVHRAYFDPNLLPLHDNYMEPGLAHDIRARSTVQREGALFDWWERLFDYTVLRRDARATREAPVWLLFHEADENHPDDPAHLVRHMAVDLRHEPLVLQYYQGPGMAVYQVVSADLEDERWTIRVWHADRWIHDLDRRFWSREIADARPDLWASDQPQTTTGNQNLTRFVRDGLFENAEPRRYAGLTRLNNGLRERARQALIAYLCGMDRVSLPWPSGGFARAAKDLSEMLLLDVEAGIDQRASRMEEAIGAVQGYVQRHELGLESDFSPDPDFGLLWERRFVSLRVWEGCKKREYYRENWIEWDEEDKARRSEGYQNLEAGLRRMALESPAPGALVHWEGPRPEPRPGLQLTQDRDPATMALLPIDSPTVVGRDGYDLLVTRDRHARPSLLAALPDPFATQTLPTWVEAAVRLGARFVRVAASGLPPTSAKHEPIGALYGEGCCTECGRVHDPMVDEYYFWLMDSESYAEVFPDQNADVMVSSSDLRPAWHDANSLPSLLFWESLPTVHLMWCRVHNGEFLPPARSAEGVRVSSDASELVFMGRTADSLRFVVTDGVSPVGHQSLPPAGFRYDMVTDQSVTLPLVVNPPAAGDSVGELPAYPYFAYFTPGAESTAAMYAPVMSVARALRTHCRPKGALTWYEKILHPLEDDVRWCVDGESDRPCDDVVSDEYARRRALTLHYLETLLEWGDAVARNGSREAMQRARQIYGTAERILGARPESIRPEDDGASPQTVTNFAAQGARLNPRLMAIYDRVNDRLAAVRAGLDARRQKREPLHQELSYMGESRLRDGWQDTSDWCMDDGDWCMMPSPYRFQFCLQKAQELAADVRGLGGALLSAFEKGDAEYLAALRASHEKQILELALSIRKDQWRESDWQVQALQKTKEIAQTRRRYYQWLIDRGRISEEHQYVSYTLFAMGLRTASQIPEFVARVIALIPDLYVGMAMTQRIPVGTKLAETFSTFGRILNIMADIFGTMAGLRLTEAGWVRREDEWRHQVEVLDIEIEQVERQILAAERRRDIALRELNNHQRQIENAAEVLTFLRDKFTNHQLYLWLQKETAALYYQMYELALQAARQAERAFNFERGHTARRFVPNDAWDDLHEGLLAGERLQIALRQMEKSYLDQNTREYELTKHVSLRAHFPWAFLQLQLTGACEIEIPEWMFDLDYPGHYMRRIKNVTMTIPAVVGPYTGVHCRLTLLGSATRVDPRLGRDVDGCCPDGVENGYRAAPDDARVVKQYAAAEAIATSSGQNDSGMFELNFRDERYLPFEYAGAVSRWRIELPPENNYFDLETLSDLVLHLNYMAREGGEVLRAAARESARLALPDDGWRLLDVRHEMPTAWQRLRAGVMNEGERPMLGLRMTRDMFGFLPGDRSLSIQRLEFLFEAPNADPSAHHTLEFRPSEELAQLVEKPEMCEIQTIECVASAEWPGLYHGVLEVPASLLGAGQERDLGTLVFLSNTGEISRAFLVCGYELAD